METQVQAGNRKIRWHQLDKTQDPEFVRDVITRETHNWGSGLLLLGLVQIVANNFLDPVWGVVLILVAASSFYFRSAAMFPVYGVTLAWAMVSNVLSGDLRWMLFGLVQAYWAITTFRQFLIVRRATSRLGIGLGAGTTVRADRAASIFPWLGCALSALAAVGLVALIIVMVAWPVLAGHALSDRMTDLAGAAVMDSACLGLALAVAALLARFRWRLVSILAALGGGLLLGFFLLLAFL